MKALAAALAASIALVGPVMGQESTRRVWVDVVCERIVIFDGSTYFYQRPDAPLTTCMMAAKGETGGDMTCDDGASVHVDALTDNAILLAGVEMNLYGGPLPCGAGGAEWPD